MTKKEKSIQNQTEMSRAQGDGTPHHGGDALEMKARSTPAGSCAPVQINQGERKTSKTNKSIPHDGRWGIYQYGKGKRVENENRARRK